MNSNFSSTTTSTSTTTLLDLILERIPGYSHSDFDSLIAQIRLVGGLPLTIRGCELGVAIEFDCTVCLDSHDDLYFKLLCGHSFGLKCLLEYVSYMGNYRCPLCRAEVDLDMFHGLVDRVSGSDFEEFGMGFPPMFGDLLGIPNGSNIIINRAIDGDSDDFSDGSDSEIDMDSFEPLVVPESFVRLFYNGSNTHDGERHAFSVGGVHDRIQLGIAGLQNLTLFGVPLVNFNFDISESLFIFRYPRTEYGDFPVDLTEASLVAQLAGRPFRFHIYSVGDIHFAFIALDSVVYVYIFYADIINSDGWLRNVTLYFGSVFTDDGLVDPRLGSLNLLSVESQVVVVEDVHYSESLGSEIIGFDLDFGFDFPFIGDLYLAGSLELVFGVVTDMGVVGHDLLLESNFEFQTEFLTVEDSIELSDVVECMCSLCDVVECIGYDVYDVQFSSSNVVLIPELFVESDFFNRSDVEVVFVDDTMDSQSVGISFPVPLVYSTRNRFVGLGVRRCDSQRMDSPEFFADYLRRLDASRVESGVVQNGICDSVSASVRRLIMSSSRLVSNFGHMLSRVGRATRSVGSVVSTVLFSDMSARDMVSRAVESLLGFLPKTVSDFIRNSQRMMAFVNSVVAMFDRVASSDLLRVICQRIIESPIGIVTAFGMIMSSTSWRMKLSSLVVFLSLLGLDKFVIQGLFSWCSRVFSDGDAFDDACGEAQMDDGEDDASDSGDTFSRFFAFISKFAESDLFSKITDVAMPLYCLFDEFRSERSFSFTSWSKSLKACRQNLDSVSEVFSDCGFPLTSKDIFMSRMKKQFMSLVDKVDAVDVMVNRNIAYYLNEQHFLEFQAVVDELRAVRSRVATHKFSKFVTTTMNQELLSLFRRINDLGKKINLSRSRDGIRPTPAVCLVQGISGTGKSHVAPLIISRVKNICYKLYESDPEKYHYFSTSNLWSVWNKQNRDEYDTGYDGQEVEYNDDAFVQSDDLDHPGYITCISNNNIGTVQADLEDKGKPYRVRFMLVCCNVFPRVSKTVNNIDALHNRFSKLYYQMTEDGERRDDCSEKRFVKTSPSEIFDLNGLYDMEPRLNCRWLAAQQDRWCDIDSVVRSVVDQMIYNQRVYELRLEQSRNAPDFVLSDDDRLRFGLDAEAQLGEDLAGTRFGVLSGDDFGSLLGACPSLRTLDLRDPQAFGVPDGYNGCTRIVELAAQFPELFSPSLFVPNARANLATMRCLRPRDFDGVVSFVNTNLLVFRNGACPVLLRDGVLHNVISNVSLMTNGSGSYVVDESDRKMFRVSEGFVNFSSASYSFDSPRESSAGFYYTDARGNRRRMGDFWEEMSSDTEGYWRARYEQFRDIMGNVHDGWYSYLYKKAAHHVEPYSFSDLYSNFYVYVSGFFHYVLFNLFGISTESTNYILTVLLSSLVLSLCAFFFFVYVFKSFAMWFYHRSGRISRASHDKVDVASDDVSYIRSRMARHVSSPDFYHFVNDSVFEACSEMHPNVHPSDIEWEICTRVMNKLSSKYAFVLEVPPNGWENSRFDMAVYGWIVLILNSSKCTSVPLVSGYYRDTRPGFTGLEKLLVYSEPQRESRDNHLFDHHPNVAEVGRYRVSEKNTWGSSLRVENPRKHLKLLENPLYKSFDPQAAFAGEVGESQIGLDVNCLDVVDSFAHRNLISFTLEPQVGLASNFPKSDAGHSAYGWGHSGFVISVSHGVSVGDFAFGQSCARRPGDSSWFLLRAVVVRSDVDLCRWDVVTRPSGGWTDVPSWFSGIRSRYGAPQAQQFQSLLRFLPSYADYMASTRSCTGLQFVPEYAMLVPSSISMDLRRVNSNVGGVRTSWDEMRVTSLNVDVQLFRGSCGSPLFANQSSCGRKLIGMHNVYISAGVSYSILVYRELIESLLPESGSAQLGDMVKFHDRITPVSPPRSDSLKSYVESPHHVLFDERVEPTAGMVNRFRTPEVGSAYVLPVGRLERDGSPAVQRPTHLFRESDGDACFDGPVRVKSRTKFSGVFEVDRQNSVLSRFDSRVKSWDNVPLDGSGRRDLLMRQTNLYHHISSTDIDMDLLDDMRKQLTSHYISVMSGRRVGACSVEVALRGDLDISSAFGPMNLRSSNGLPFTAMGFSDGHALWSYPQDGSVVRLNEVSYRCEDMARARIDAASRGFSVPSVWKNCLKDESLPMRKIVDPKTRLFVAAPRHVVLSFRMLFGPFKAVWTELRDHLFHSVGINVHSPEWATLYRNMLRFPHHFDIDFESYDKRELSEFMHAAGLVVIDTIDAISHDGFRDARLVFWRELVYTFCCSYDSVFCKLGGCPSGATETTVLNCILHFFYIWYCFRRTTGMHSLQEFRTHVFLTCFGDDGMYGVSDEVFSKFNFRSVKEVLAEIGQVATPGKKDCTDLDIDLCVDELSFLKRSFVPVNGSETIVKSPIVLDSLYGEFEMSSIAPNDVLTWSNALEEAMLEACQHSESEFDSFRLPLLERVRSGDFSVAERSAYSTLLSRDYKTMCGIWLKRYLAC